MAITTARGRRPLAAGTAQLLNPYDSGGRPRGGGQGRSVLTAGITTLAAAGALLGAGSTAWADEEPSAPAATEASHDAPNAADAGPEQGGGDKAEGESTTTAEGTSAAPEGEGPATVEPSVPVVGEGPATVQPSAPMVDVGPVKLQSPAPAEGEGPVKAEAPAPVPTGEQDKLEGVSPPPGDQPVVKPVDDGADPVDIGKYLIDRRSGRIVAMTNHPHTDIAGQRQVGDHLIDIGSGRIVNPTPEKPSARSAAWQAEPDHHGVQPPDPAEWQGKPTRPAEPPRWEGEGSPGKQAAEGESPAHGEKKAPHRYRADRRGSDEQRCGHHDAHPRKHGATAEVPAA